MGNKKALSGLLTALQFASDCERQGLPISPEHALWVLEQGLIKPLTHIDGVDYYNEYQLYSMDLIHERRLQSLDFPKTGSARSASKKIHITAPPITWQRYLILLKNLIAKTSLEWEPVARLLLEIHLMRNKFVVEAQKNKEKFNDEASSVLFSETMRALIRTKGPESAREVLSRHPDVSEDVLRYWQTHGLPTRVIRHNVTMLLSTEIPNFWDIVERNENKLSSTFTYGNPIRLSNFYLRSILLIYFFLTCLNKGQEPDVSEVFTKRYVERLCAICGEHFLPTERGGKLQVLCGKEACDREKRRRAERSRRSRRR